MNLEEMLDLDNRLSKIPLEELPRLHVELNSHKWPLELGESPVNYGQKTVCEEAIYLLREIERRCGNKAIWRYIKIEKENYTQQMFEDWWVSSFLADEPSYKFNKWLGEQNCGEQSQNRKRNTYKISYFLLGFLFAKILFVFISFST